LLSPRFLLIGAAFIGAIALTSFITSGISSRRNDSDRQSLAVALAALDSQSLHAAFAERNANAEKVKALAAERQVSVYELVAKKQTAKAEEAWALFEASIKANVCDSTCITAARSAHLSDSIALVASDSALAAEKIAAARYKLGLDQAVTALADLNASAHEAIHVAQPFTKPPSRLRQILPKLGVAATAGLDLHGNPNVVTGVSLGYNF
jgi:hypothetical protein